MVGYREGGKGKLPGREGEGKGGYERKGGGGGASWPGCLL